MCTDGWRTAQVSPGPGQRREGQFFRPGSHRIMRLCDLCPGTCPHVHREARLPESAEAHHWSNISVLVEIFSFGVGVFAKVVSVSGGDGARTHDAPGTTE